MLLAMLLSALLPRTPAGASSEHQAFLIDRGNEPPVELERTESAAEVAELLADLEAEVLRFWVLCGTQT